MDAVISPREFVPPVDDGPDERPQGDLEHAEVEPRQPDAEPADEEPGQGGDDRSGQKTHPHGERGFGQEQGDGVSPHSVEHGMVELIHPAVAHQKVQAHGQEGNDVDQAQNIDEKTGDQGRNQEKDDKTPEEEPKPAWRVYSFCPSIHLGNHKNQKLFIRRLRRLRRLRRDHEDAYEKKDLEHAKRK